MRKDYRWTSAKTTGGIIQAAKGRVWRGVKVLGLYALCRGVGGILALTILALGVAFFWKHLYTTPIDGLGIFAIPLQNLRYETYLLLSRYPDLWPVWDLIPVLNLDNPLTLLTDGGWIFIPIAIVAGHLLHWKVKDAPVPSSVITVHGTMHGDVGMVNSGTVAIENIDSIAGRVNRTASPGEAHVLDAIKVVTKAVAEAPIQDEAQRTDLLDLLVQLAQQAARPVAERSPTAARVIVRTLDTTLNMVGNLASVWAAWGSDIKKFFGF